MKENHTFFILLTFDDMKTAKYGSIFTAVIGVTVIYW
jgi:hypothetical protein